MIQTRLKYPIGQQDFQSIREEGKAYVDKTARIFELINYSKFIFLSRPRRFGKSLLLSTIQAYFEGKKDLFEGLEISHLDKEWLPHPVIHLELSGTDPNDPESLTQLLEQQFREWEKLYDIAIPLKSFGARFRDIIISASRLSGRQVVILVDEYDNPLINTVHINEKHELYRSLLKSIYSNLKPLDRYIRFGMFTGISRFSKMNIFSGLNNLNDISFDNRFADICGFTFPEINHFFKQGINDMSLEMNLTYNETLGKLTEWYDGYHFSEKCPDIYNPFSVLNALDKRKINAYWLETGTPEFLIEKLKNSKENFTEIFNNEVQETELAESDTSFSSPLALLYQTGYLTIKNYIQDTDSFHVGIPNKEVKAGFLPTLLGEFIGKPKIRTAKEASFIKEALEKGEINLFLNQLSLFLGSVPYTVIPKVSEKYFQNTLYLLFTVMGLDVEAEKPSSFGRSDLVVDTPKYIYIFELKLDGSSEKALRQIEERGYEIPFNFKDKKIIKIGLNFSSETRTLKDWTSSL